MVRPALLLLFSACLLGCGNGGSTASSTSTSSSTTSTTTSTTSSASSTDLTKLPIGDGKYATSAQVGYVYACQTTFSGGGASSTGPWINSASNTYDYTAKTHVSGAVTWPNAFFTITLSGSSRLVSGNDLPINHTTGTFPIAKTDPAYSYDQNPNTITAQVMTYTLPANPTAAAAPTCVPMGAIGVLTSGVQIFNALDAQGRDAVAHEVQDNCDGHPQLQGAYHYHSLTNCISDPGTGHSALIGYAFDGFGIYGSRGENGQQLTNADLDACHGHTHAITWDGTSKSMYHYHATREYPYTIGCYRGTAVKGQIVTARIPIPRAQPDHHHHTS